MEEEEISLGRWWGPRRSEAGIAGRKTVVSAKGFFLAWPLVDKPSAPYVRYSPWQQHILLQKGSATIYLKLRHVSECSSYLPFFLFFLWAVRICT